MLHTFRQKILEDLFDYEITYALFQKYIAAVHGVFEWKYTYCSPRANIQFNLRLYTIVAHRIILNAWLQIVFSVRFINLPAPQTTTSLGLCEPFLMLPWAHTVCYEECVTICVMLMLYLVKTYVGYRVVLVTE
jgi:hypothetical protein